MLFLDKNISYFTIPLALVLPLCARFYSGLSGPAMKLFDRHSPRNFKEAVMQSDMDEKTRKRILWAEGCCANGFEVLPVFAAAVTAGNTAGVSAGTMNLMSIGWIISRFVYTYVYIWYQEQEKLAMGQAPLRFKVWSVGAVTCMSMFVLAGLRM